MCEYTPWFLWLTRVWPMSAGKHTCRCVGAKVRGISADDCKKKKKNSPAAVIVGVSLQRGGSSGQAQPREGVVVRELGVRQAGHAVRLVVHVLPVRVQARGPLGKGPEQVAVQLVHYLLVHAGFKLPGEEGGTHHLLQSNRGRVGGGQGVGWGGGASGEYSKRGGRVEIKKKDGD